MKILGIGNAIVDVLCKVTDEFLTKNNLTKSTMKLVDEIEFKKLLSNLKIQDTVSGGSVANSIVGLSQLGNEVGFIGKVSDDDLGQKYEQGLEKEKVKYFYTTETFFSKTRQFACCFLTEHPIYAGYMLSLDLKHYPEEIFSKLNTFLHNVDFKASGLT